MKLSIIIPAHNEEANIARVITGLIGAVSLDYEIVVVNDHSQDSTCRIVEGLKAKYENIRLIKNQGSPGFANTLRAGFKAAAGEFMLPVMADLCDDPVLIMKMYQEAGKGYDIICGSRYMKKGKKIGGPLLKTVCSGLAGKITYFLGIPTHDITNSFKMYRREVIEAVDSNAESFEISMEIPLKAHLKGFKITELPTVWNSRELGESSFKVVRLIPVYLKLYLWAIFKNLLKNEK